MPGRPVPTMCVGVGAPPYCFVLAVYFMRATNGRPYKSNKTLSMPVGEDSISSRNVVRIYQKPSPVGEGGSRRLTDEVSVSLFALYIRLRTNKRSLTNLGRGGACSSRNVVRTIYSAVLRCQASTLGRKAVVARVSTPQIMRILS